MQKLSGMRKRNFWIFKVFAVNGDEVLMRERKLGVAESGRLIPQLNVVSFASTLDAYMNSVTQRCREETNYITFVILDPRKLSGWLTHPKLLHTLTWFLFESSELEARNCA